MRSGEVGLGQMRSDDIQLMSTRSEEVIRVRRGHMESDGIE